MIDLIASINVISPKPPEHAKWGIGEYIATVQDNTYNGRIIREVTIRYRTDCIHREPLPQELSDHMYDAVRKHIKDSMYLTCSRSLDSMPLYINSPNDIMRQIAINRLKIGE